MYVLTAEMRRVIYALKRLYGRRNLENREIAENMNTLFDLLNRNEDDFRAFLRNELGFTSIKIENARSLVDLFDNMPFEATWKSLGQSGVREIMKLNAQDRRGVINWVNARQANNPTGYIAPSAINDKIHSCGSYPAPQVTKPVAERNALLRVLEDLVNSGKLTIDDIAETKQVSGRRIPVRSMLSVKVKAQ